VTLMMRGRAINIWVASISLAMVAAAANARSTGSGRRLQRTTLAEGRVVWVTAESTYIDRGRRHGMPRSGVVRLEGATKESLQCPILEVGDSWTLCRGRGSPGQAARFEAEPKVPIAPRENPMVRTSARRAGQVRDALSRAPVSPRVAYRGSRDNGGLDARAAVEASHSAWGRVRGTTTFFQRESLGVRARARNVGARGVRLRASLDVWGWTSRPEDARYRPGEPFQVLAHELNASFAPTEGAWRAAFGRLRPRHVPGLGRLDGAQLGWRSTSRSTEVGLYGGTLPELVSLAPSTELWTTGLYARHEVRVGDRGLASASGRLGYAQAARQRGRVSGELLTMIHGGSSWDLSSAVAAGGSDPNDLDVDSWRVLLSVRPIENVRTHISGRENRRLDSFAFPPRPQWFEPTRRGDVGAEWDATRWFHVGARGGVSANPSGDHGRAHLDLSARVDTALPWDSEVALGYIEQLGWLSARTTYLRLAGAPAETVHVQLHGVFTYATDLASAQNLGARALVRWLITDDLELRASLSGRSGGWRPDSYAGLAGQLGLQQHF
jgi:hypothetical protein